jgi:mediator of RNA polymerase II transcription subunit 14
MLSFDLRTATFSYSPGFNASITYSSVSDSYECTFVRSSPVNTPATPATMSGDASPHEILGPLLSHKLNELTKSEDVKKGTVGREFITVSDSLWLTLALSADWQLLRNTLPLLLEIESVRSRSMSGFPELVVSAVDEFRLVWDIEGTKR